MRSGFFNLMVIFSLLFLNFSAHPSHALYDLSLKWVKVDKNLVFEGEVVKIKARVENMGGESHPFAISFYLDFTDSRHLLGRVYEESIKYYRIPSMEWDTKGVNEGEHKIIAHVSDENEENNYGICNITVLSSKKKANLLIEEIYYHSRPHRNNEFLCIVNAGDERINLGDYYLTTQPWKRCDKQNKVFLPSITFSPGEKVYITQNATSFEFEMGFPPDYEYYNSSSIPDLERKGKFVMANDGGVVCIKDRYNHTIDTVVYGNSAFNEGWRGKAVKGVGEGVIMKRNGYNDTNTSNDWESNRTYIIGQSNFEVWHGKVRKAILFCSPDCSYRVISREIGDAEELLINMYTFTNPFVAEMIEKKNSSIKLLLDGNVIGGLPMEERWIAYRMSKRGEVRYMLRDEEKGIYKRYRYNHAKYVVYGKKCMVESANWGMRGIPMDTSYGNREWGIVMENESLCNFMENLFYYDFNPDFQDSIGFDESDFLRGKPPDDFTPSHFIPHGEYKAIFSPLYINDSSNATLILAPDNAEEELLGLINNAKREILVEQMYIEKDWEGGMNPLIHKILEKNESGVAVYVILNHNPEYESTSSMNEEVAKFLRQHGIKVRLQNNINIHNKGMIVDEKFVLISSINWGENSVRRNREMGVILENEEAAKYFSNIFWYDWNYDVGKESMDFQLPFIILIFSLTFLTIYLYRRE